MKLPRNVFCLTFPPFQTLTRWKRKDQSSCLSAVSVKANKKKKVKRREWKAWKAAAASFGCSRTGWLRNLSSLQHAEGNQLHFSAERRTAEDGSNNEANEQLVVELIGQGKLYSNARRRPSSEPKNAQKWAERQISSRNTAPTERWSSGGVGVNGVLHSTVNFKNVMPTNWVQKHPTGDWTSRQLDQIRRRGFSL